MPNAEDGGSDTPRLQLTEMFAGAFPDNLLPGVYEFRKPETAADARRLVRESHARGYRQIKIIRDDSYAWSGEEYRVAMMPEPVYRALVAEARALDMRVYVHATQREVADTALDAGVDAFLHGVMDAELEAGAWRRMSELGAAWAPTVNALLCFGEQGGYARRVLADRRFSARLDPREAMQLTEAAEIREPMVAQRLGLNRIAGGEVQRSANFGRHV